MVDRFLLAGLTWALIAACLYGMRRHSPLNLFVLGLFSTALVATFFPILSTVVQPSSWRNVVQAPEPLVLGVQGEYLAFAAGLGLAFLAARALGLLSSRETPRLVGTSPSARRRDAIVASALVGLGGVLYALYVMRVGVGSLTSRDDYAEKYLVSQGLGPYAFGLNLMMAGCLWAEASGFARFGRTAFRLVATLIAVWSVAFISVRTNFVVLCIGYAWIQCRDRRLVLARVRLSLVALLVVVYVSLEAFSLFRGATQEGGMGRALTLIGTYAEDSLASIVGGSELSHPFLTTLEVETCERAGDLGGSSYVEALPAFLPLAIHPDRPLTLSEQFVRAQYADMAERGGGTAFSLVAEAWWNFGSIVGPLLVGLAAGLVLLFVERRAHRRRDGTIARLAPYFVYLVVIGHRSESAIFVKQGLSILMPAFGFVVAAELYGRARRAHAPRTTVVAAGSS